MGIQRTGKAMKVLAGVMLLSTLGQTTQPAPGTDVTATLQVIQLTSAARISEENGQRWFGERMWRSEPGMSISAVAEFSVPLDKVNPVVQISEAWDDQHHDLLRGTEARLTTFDNNPYQQGLLSKDRRAVLVQLSMANRPPPEARELTVKGRFSVVREGATEEVTSEKVDLLVGKDIKAGNTLLHITGMGALPLGKVSISMLTTSADAIKGLVFLDGDGQVVRTSPEDSYMDRFSNRGEARRILTYAVGPGLEETARVRLTVGKDLQPVDVPFQAKVRLGL